MKQITLVLLGTMFLGTALAGSVVDDFREAKRVLLHRVYTPAYRTTFYCQCEFDSEKRVKADSCGYRVRHDATRGSRIEWEHIVPASVFGQPLQCWSQARRVCGRKGGRKCCGQTNQIFRSLEADMHNLVPAVGELNGDRENYRFGIIAGEPRRYGRCDFEVQGQLVEPRSEIRGDIARAYLYMNDRTIQELGYSIMSGSEKNIYRQWDQADPVDDWECQRHDLISRLQGTWNPYVLKGCE